MNGGPVEPESQNSKNQEVAVVVHVEPHLGVLTGTIEIRFLLSLSAEAKQGCIFTYCLKQAVRLHSLEFSDLLFLQG